MGVVDFSLSPSGNGWDFTPTNGWGWDNFGGFNGGGYGGAFDIYSNFQVGTFVGSQGGPSGTSVSPGGGGPSIGGPSFTWDLGGAITSAAAGAVGSAVGVGGVGTVASKAAGLLGITISWSRIAAFLLGLLLILGGIYLMRPVQQVVNSAVRDAVVA